MKKSRKIGTQKRVILSEVFEAKDLATPPKAPEQDWSLHGPPYLPFQGLQTSWRPPHPAAQRGSVLIIVMIVCLGLVSLSLVFGHSMLMAYRGSDNSLAGHQADQAIEGGARYAKYLMSSVTNPGDLPDPANYQSEALPVGDATFWFIGTPTPSDSGTTPVFGLIDEASKLNLNVATQDMLMNLPGMTQELATAITQWRNTSADASGTTGGFSVSTTPVKNAPFESVQELALLTGTDAALLYGQDANLNHVLDPNEEDEPRVQLSTTTDGRLDAGLLEYVTVFSMEPGVRTDGTARINVAQRPPPSALNALLANNFTKDRAAAISRAIQTGPPIGSVIEFSLRSGMTEEEFGKISDALRGPRLKGLINVNTASQTVLACIPGITTDIAAQIVATRSSRTQPSTGLTWVAPLLGPDAMPKAGPWLTGKTYQVCADVAAVGRLGRGYRRTQFIVDSSTGTPRIVYRRNLASLGWALGGEVREMLAMKRDIR